MKEDQLFRRRRSTTWLSRENDSLGNSAAVPEGVGPRKGEGWLISSIFVTTGWSGAKRGEAAEVFPLDPVEVDGEAGLVLPGHEPPGLDRRDPADPAVFVPVDPEPHPPGEIDLPGRLDEASGEGEVPEDSLPEPAGRTPEENRDIQRQTVVSSHGFLCILPFPPLRPGLRRLACCRSFEEIII